MRLNVERISQLWKVIRRRRPFLLGSALVGLLFLSSACSLLNREGTPDEAEPESAAQVVLACSEECARRGQCGRTTDDRQVVLGHPEGPALEAHQMFFPVETAVTQLATNSRTVQVVATGAEFEHTFYQVTRPEDGRVGWVAGWCVRP